MSDRFTQSYSDSDGRNGKSTHSVQSVWMARWTRTSYNATEEAHYHAPLNVPENKGNDQAFKPPPLQRSIVQLETVSKVSKSVKRLRESGTQTFEVINESLRTSSRTIAKETRGCRSLPVHSPCKKGATSIPLKDDQGTCDMQQALRPQLDPNFDSTMVALCPRQSCFFPVAHPAGETLAGKEKVPKWRTLEHEHNNYHNQSSTSLVCEDKLDSRPEPGRSITPSLRQNHTFLQDVPSTSSKYLPEIGGEEFQKFPGHSFFRLLQDESRTETKELHPRSYDQQKLPHPLHEVETMRTSNTVDSPMGLRCNSQKNRSLLIAKGIDANLFEGNKVVGNSRTWSEFNREASSSDHDRPSKSFGRHKGGIKLQLLDCSTGSEGKENIGDNKPPSEDVLKNESSAETDTIDMDVFQEKNQRFGIGSSIVHKVNEMDQNSPPLLALGCSRKGAGHKPFNLDINLELPALTDNVEPTSSRTLSLDLGSMLAHAEQPSSLRADLCPEGLPGPDPSSRWVKRLKLGASGSLAFGTKSSSFLGESSHEKSHKLLGRIAKAPITSSGPTSSKVHGRELMVHENTPDLTMNSNPSSMSVIKKDLELLTSQSWVQRLLRNGAISTQKRPQPVAVCEPQSSKLELDDYFKKKQLPSLGAMALMGKAMNGFQPCEFHRRGPLVVWNTSSF